MEGNEQGRSTSFCYPGRSWTRFAVTACPNPAFRWRFRKDWAGSSSWESRVQKAVGQTARYQRKRFPPTCSLVLQDTIGGWILETVKSWLRLFWFSKAQWFPTCQVRVVRFYHSCSPPSRSSSPPPPRPPPSPPPPLPPLPRPLPPPCQLSANLFANFRAQWALLDLNCRLPIWVGTAGPQPQGSERSGHRWTSARDLPSRVGTAGPQPGTFRAQWAPLDLTGQMECQNICHIECQNICEKECHIECQNICQIERQNIYQIKCWKICQIEYQNRCQIEC